MKLISLHTGTFNWALYKNDSHIAWAHLFVFLIWWPHLYTCRIVTAEKQAEAVRLPEATEKQREAVQLPREPAAQAVKRGGAPRTDTQKPDGAGQAAPLCQHRLVQSRDYGHMTTGHMTLVAWVVTRLGRSFVSYVQ